MPDVNDLVLEFEEKIRSFINEEETIEYLLNALEYASIHHTGQFRKSGEPYIIHPINVALILCDLNVGSFTIAAGLMHDLIEDTDVTYEDIEERFGTETANLVEGTTKISMIKFSTKSEAEIENQKKLIIGMIKDVRVIIVKLADRLHNMRTLGNLNVEKQKKIANETLEIFAPVAHRLGMYNIKSELEDLALYYTKRSVYDQIVENISLTANNLDESLNEIIAIIENMLQERGVEYNVSGRLKSVYSIYKKMVNKNKKIEEIYDIVAIRVIVNSVSSCYLTLGLIHELYRPIPHRFKDYISMPKPNMYQALHTTVIGPTGHSYEIQIKTQTMHEVAEQGIASHWKYKSKGSTFVTKETHEEIENKYEWFKNMMSFDQDDYNSADYLEAIKHDVFSSSSIYVFTPKGNTIHLPSESTPIDFAYKVHTEVGHHMVGAKVNGSIVQLTTKLETGDVVEIMTNSNSLGPSIDWIDIASSSYAKNKIRQFYRQSEREEFMLLGKDKLRKAFNSKNISFNNFIKSKECSDLVTSFKLSTFDELLAAIGGGTIKAESILERYLLLIKNADSNDLDWILTKKYKVDKGVIVPGVDNLPIQLSRCCTPIPGDEIVGFVSKTGVIKVHRSKCPNLADGGDERSITVLWADDSTGIYETYLKIQCMDRTSLLSDVLKIFGSLDSNITELNSKTEIGMHTMSMTVLVKNREHFYRLIDNIKKVKGVMSVERIIK